MSERGQRRGASYYWSDENLILSDESEPAAAAIWYRSIGHVEANRTSSGMGEHGVDGESRIVLDPTLTEGLTGVEAGDRLLVVFHFHRSREGPLLQHSRGDTTRPKRGVFSLRSPRRPNPIGVTVVEILTIDGNVVSVRGLDALDGTPVLDLKPISANNS